MTSRGDGRRPPPLPREARATGALRVTDEPERLFLAETHPMTRRTVVLEDDGVSAWAYLTHPGDLQLEADTWVYNRSRAASSRGTSPTGGSAPPAPEGVVAGSALDPSPSGHEWSFRWNDDGDAVGIFNDGVPLALLESGRARGMSRNLLRTCAWGEAWSHARWAESGLEDGQRRP